jgi:predicted nucleic acid-binding protein
MVLAKELEATLLMDDAKARKYAKLLNLEVIGTLGLLELAKNHGLIPSVREAINDMLAEGHCIEDNLIKRILKDVGES